MSALIRFNPQYLPLFSKNWRRFLTWGIILVALGLLAISAAGFSTLVSVVFLGFLILVGGAIIAFDTFTFWWGKWGGFTLHLVAAILYVWVGFFLIQNPVEGAVSLTLLLGIFYTVIGLIRIGFSAFSKMPKWGWGLANGVITLILGLLILSHWPASSIFIIGLLVGIDLFFCGWAYIMMAITARKLNTVR